MGGVVDVLAQTRLRGNTMNVRLCMLSLICCSSLLSSYSQAQVPSCRNSIEALISGDVYSVEDSQITANSVYDDDTSNEQPQEARLPNGTGYCAPSPADMLLGIPCLSINFTTPYLIVSFNISGSMEKKTYVELLKIEYDGIVISEMFNTTLTSAVDVENIELSTPVVAKHLRILPFQWSGNPPCIRVEVFGCPLDQAILPANDDESKNVVVKKNFLIVETIIPAIGLICIIVVSIVIGVLAFKAMQRKGDKSVHTGIPHVRSVHEDMLEDSQVDRTLKLVKNSLYDTTSIVRQGGRDPATKAAVASSYETIDLSLDATTKQKTKYASVEVTPSGSTSSRDVIREDSGAQYRGNYVDVVDSRESNQNGEQRPNKSSYHKPYPRYEVCTLSQEQDEGATCTLESMSGSGPHRFAV